MSQKSPIYVSIDIEADGPIPGPGGNSMLSLGAAAFDLNSQDPRVPINTYEANLRPLEGATQDPGTMTWWATQKDAWDYVTSNQQDPLLAMRKFRGWLNTLGRPLVMVGYPVTFDFQFVYWYLVHFTGFPVPFGFSGLDIKTLAAVKMNAPYPEASKRNMPKHWFEGCPLHTHKALDDAIGQGILFVNIMRDTQP